MGDGLWPIAACPKDDYWPDATIVEASVVGTGFYRTIPRLQVRALPVRAAVACEACMSSLLGHDTLRTWPALSC